MKFWRAGSVRSCLMAALLRGSLASSSPESDRSQKSAQMCWMDEKLRDTTASSREFRCCLGEGRDVRVCRMSRKRFGRRIGGGLLIKKGENMEDKV